MGRGEESGRKCEDHKPRKGEWRRWVTRDEEVKGPSSAYNIMHSHTQPLSLDSISCDVLRESTGPGLRLPSAIAALSTS